MLFNIVKKFDFNNYLQRSFVNIFLLNFFRVGFQFLIGIILVHGLKATDYGVYVYIINILNTMVLLSGLGVPNLSTREVAVLSTSKQWGKLKNYILHVHKVNIFIIMALLVLTLIMLHFFLVHRYEQRFIRAASLAILLLPFLTLGLLRAGILRGLKFPFLAQLPEYFITPFLFLSFLVVNYFFFRGRFFNLTYTILLQWVSVFIGFIIGLIVLFKKLPQALFVSIREKSKIHAVFQKAFPFLCLAGIGVINTRVDVLLLGFFTPSADIGVYNVVVLFNQTVSLPIMIYATIASPVIADLFYKQNKTELQKVVAFCTSINFILISVASLALIILGHWILTFLYTPSFGHIGYIPLIILLVANVFNAGFGVPAMLLNMSGYERISLRVMIGMTVLNIICNLLLVPVLGITGSALSTAISNTFYAGILYIFVRRKIGIHPSVVYNLANFIRRLFNG